MGAAWQALNILPIVQGGCNEAIRKSIQRMTTFKHSGNAGDIIYMLPTIQSHRGATLYLNPNRPAQYAAGLTHPGGAVMLNERMCDMLKPLVEFLGIKCEIWNGEEVDYDLDLFREQRINLSAYDIRRWIMAVYPELTPPAPWIYHTVQEMAEGYQLPRGPYITLNLSERYRNNAAGNATMYEELNKWTFPIYFLGVEQEFEKAQELIPDLQHFPVDDYLHMMLVIKGGRRHFGNQSSPFALAEIFDFKRVLELSPYCPNVVSTGQNWGVVYNRENMKYHVNKLLQSMPKIIETEPFINPS